MNRWILNTAVMFATIVGVFINNLGTNTYALSCIVLAVSVMSVVRARKDWYMFTIYSFILYCNYSVHMVFYLKYYNDSSLFMKYIGTETASLGLDIHAIFTMCMFLIIPYVKGRRQPIRSLYIENRDNPYVVIASIVLMLWVLIFNFGSLNFEGSRGGSSPIAEYSTVFVILGAYFSGNKKPIRFALILMATLYTLKDFLMGERVAGLQLIILVLLTFYAEKLSLKKLLPPAIILLFLMRIIGDQRGYFTLTWSTLEAVMDRFSDKKFIFDTCYAVWHASMTFLNCLDFTDWGERLNLFGRFLLGVLLGNNRVEFAYLGSYSIKFFQHYAGGVLPFFAYFYLGMPGILLICAWLRFIFYLMRNAPITDNGFIRCMAIYITSSVPRWYLYYPYPITRSLILMAIGYCVFDYTDRIMKSITAKIYSSALN